METSQTEQKRKYLYSADSTVGVQTERCQVTAGATPLEKSAVKAIFNASVDDPILDGVCLRRPRKAGILNPFVPALRLRNKALSVCMICNGWHPIDAHRVMDTDVEDRPDHLDRGDVHRPKIIFHGHHQSLRL